MSGKTKRFNPEEKLKIIILIIKEPKKMREAGTPCCRQGHQRTQPVSPGRQVRFKGLQDGALWEEEANRKGKGTDLTAGGCPEENRRAVVGI